jgi:cytochrome c-type protein NapB
VTYRALRAYPGAPPRIPHGLTPGEFQAGGCNTCHERGGFSQRFGAYVPITPHPDMGACLQCHVGNSELMAVDLPSTDPSARCRQCHSPEGGRWPTTVSDWSAAEWPPLPRRLPGGAPPPIPHSLDMRGNCVACHAPPSAVQEISTSHAERSNCRQCHVRAGPDVEPFDRRDATRPPAPAGEPR